MAVLNSSDFHMALTALEIMVSETNGQGLSSLINILENNRDTLDQYWIDKIHGYKALQVKKYKQAEAWRKHNAR